MIRNQDHRPFTIKLVIQNDSVIIISLSRPVQFSDFCSIYVLELGSDGVDCRERVKQIFRVA